MKCEVLDGVLRVELGERIDVRNYEAVQEEILALIEKYTPTTVVADFCKVNYIASAGLRMLLKVGKTVKKLSIINVSRDVYDILNLTGFTNMFDTKRTIREISVDGCKIVGAGLSSTVYRIDPETVVKLFANRITLERIYNETASAKKSFVAGIPTAIPYDVVKCGDSYGTIFELLNADTLSQNFLDYPERFDELMDKYVKLLKDFHSTKPAKGAFPTMPQKFDTWLNGLKKFLPDEKIEPLKRLTKAVPTRDTMVHADCHSRNIMVQDGKLIFVDMADVAVGHPLFDIGAEYFHYIIMPNTPFGPELIFGEKPKDKDLPSRVWNELVKRYFWCHEKELPEIHKMLKYFGCLRCLIMVAKHSQISDELAMSLINMQEDLFSHIDEAEALFMDADKYFD